MGFRIDAMVIEMYWATWIITQRACRIGIVRNVGKCWITMGIEVYWRETDHKVVS